MVDEDTDLEEQEGKEEEDNEADESMV